MINMPINGLNPIAQDIGRSYGRSGKEGVLRSFPDTQRMWVTALGIFPVVAALEGWFGINIWLGRGAQLAAATAALLVIGTAPLLLNSIVDVTAKAVEMPEIESWYLGIGIVINVACTIPLALRVGVIGVPLGTAIGQVISFVVCIFLARKKIGRDITPFFCYISYVPALVSIAVAGLCEWSLHSSIPAGGIGFVLSGLLTLPAFLIYYGCVYREFLLQRLGIRPRPKGRHRRGEIEEDDSSYTSRQMMGLQALMALSVPEVTVVPYARASVRLRYSSPPEQAYGHPFEPPSLAGQPVASTFRKSSK